MAIRDHYYEPLIFDATGSKYKQRIAENLFDGENNNDFLSSIAISEEFKFSYANAGILLAIDARYYIGRLKYILLIYIVILISRVRLRQ